MLGRNPPEAVSSYIESVQSAASCLSDAVVSVGGGYYPAEIPHILEFNRGNPVRLRGTSRLWLYFQQYYRIVRSEIPGALWTVIEAGYEYSILDSVHREILVPFPCVSDVR